MASGNVFHLDQLPGFVAADQDDPPLVYFSGPLTWYAHRDPEKHRDVVALGEAVERALVGSGFEVHIPHRDGGHDDDRETYLLNRGYIARSSLVVAYYDFPSTGLGQELEVAAQHGRPVVLLVNERRGNVSTMITSSFFAKEIVIFDDHATLVERLPPVAESWARPPKPGTLATQLGAAVQRARNRMGMTQDALADAAGCSPAFVRYIETGEAARLNPSLLQLDQLAAALRTDAATLLGFGGTTRSFERRVIEFAARQGRSSDAALRVLEAAARADSGWDEDDETVARLFEIQDEIASPPPIGEG